MTSLNQPPQEQLPLQTQESVALQPEAIVEKPTSQKKRLIIFVVTFILLCFVLVGVTAAKYGFFIKPKNSEPAPTPLSQSDTSTTSASLQVPTTPTAKPSPTPTQTVKTIKCNESPNYVVIEVDNDAVGTKFLIKYKTSSEQKIPCSYNVENDDFEFETKWRASFWEFAENFILLDSGTGPPPRGMIIYDLAKRQKVFEDSYNLSWTEGSGRATLVVDNAIDYWSPIDTEVTPENCPEYQEFEGFGIEMEAWVSLDLDTMKKSELGEYRCSPRQ